MAKRAQVIMMERGSPSELTKFFQASYLQRDQNLQLAHGWAKPLHLLHRARHRPPAGNDLDVVLALGHHRARAEFTETIPRIDGRVKGDVGGRGPSPVWRRLSNHPPKWQGGRYAATTGQGKRPVAHSQPVAGGAAGWGRRGRPAMSESMTVHIIARIRSDFGAKFGIPRQSGLVDSLAAPRDIRTGLPKLRTRVRGLDGFTHLWLIWQFSSVHAEGTGRPRCGRPGWGGNRPHGRFCHPIALPAPTPSACPPCGWSD